MSFPSSLFWCRSIEHNSIRSLSYVFLSGSLLDMMVWMRWWYSMLEGEKVSCDSYVCFICWWVCVKVNLARFDNVMLIIAMYAKYEKWYVTLIWYPLWVYMRPTCIISIYQPKPKPIILIFNYDFYHHQSKGQNLPQIIINEDSKL